MSNFYVYVIFNTFGTPLYVGKGSNGRLLQHVHSSHNVRINRLFKKYGPVFPIAKIRDGLDEREAFEVEVAFIQAIGRSYKNLGPLLNMTDGGDGVAGYKWTEAQKLAVGKIRKGKRVSREAAAKVSAALKGRSKTPAHCAAVSAAKKGVKAGPMPASQRAAIGAAHRGQKRTAKAVEAMQVAAANLKASPERSRLKSQRISEALLLRSPLYKARLVEALLSG